MNAQHNGSLAAERRLKQVAGVLATGPYREDAAGTMAQCPITTHVLDTSLGRPGAGITVTLSLVGEGESLTKVGGGVTNADGRCPGLVSNEGFVAGTYRIRFDVQKYFEADGRDAFYPFCDITFIIKDAGQHYHVPLLLNPFGFSTYRGS
eukprot:m.116942 g.116942  ORF g.116942 m.116942 type:complete len:150 (+) comp21663_c0_seq1:1404-1853(+)